MPRGRGSGCRSRTGRPRAARSSACSGEQRQFRRDDAPAVEDVRVDEVAGEAVADPLEVLAREAVALVRVPARKRVLVEPEEVVEPGAGLVDLDAEPRAPRLV